MAKLLMRRIRLLAALALVAACGKPKGLVPISSAGSGSQSGPDALVLRIPLTGGTPHVYSYTHLDSVVWTAASDAPGIDHVLAFDQDAGALVLADTSGRPLRLDLRLGKLDPVATGAVRDATSADGSVVFALDSVNRVVRYTTGNTWTYSSPWPAQAVFPQDDGSLIVVGARGEQARAWKLFPPDSRVVDSAAFPTQWRALPAQAGERLYVTTDSGLIGLAARTLDWSRLVRFGAPIDAAVSTPSGDRVFVATERGTAVSVVDRYTNEIAARIKLPGRAADLRVDPLGRYLLVRTSGADSAWVVSIGTYQVQGAVATEWRPDLPFVGPDGAIALLQRRNVVFIDGVTLRPARTVRNGARDFWYQFEWNGFRPRASSLDQPVVFNLAAADSLRTALDAQAADSAARAAQLSDSLAQQAGQPVPRDSVAAPVAYIVSFAAMLSLDRAQQLAAQITVEGQRARIVTSTHDGTPIYRVVLGPYPTRDEADRVGRTSQHTYWVYEATP